MPPALGRFSTITVWPSGLVIACATTRATVSVGPPAAYGTSMVMFRVGYCCAEALDAKAANAESDARRSDFMTTPVDVDGGAPGGIRTHDPWLRRPIL